MREKTRSLYFYAVVLGLLAAGYQAARYGLLLEDPVLAGGSQTAKDSDRQTDREAIAKLGQEFREAFQKSDARAIAALYTRQCEYYDETSGESFRGRAEVEKAYTDLFKARPGSKIDVQDRSLRFLAADTAILEGLVRPRPVGSELPVSTRYSCILAREDGQWRIALEREWGVEEDKLEDLAWLVGDWTAKPKECELLMSFRWNDKKTLLVDHFTVKESGRVTSSGTQRIGLDPQSGRIRSWLIDQNGGRGQSHWMRDGNSWLLDSVGTLANGVETTSVNIISRINDDSFTWRSVNRRIGADELPPTDPIRVTRVKTGN
jgi:uncharacterized protein (TIGR02246 family)